MTDKGERDIVDAELHRKLQVLQALLGERRHGQWPARHAHALPLAEQTAADHSAFSPPSGYGANLQLDPAIVEQHAVRDVQSLDQLGMAHLDLVFGGARRTRQEYMAATHEALECRLQRTRADLRA